MKMTSSEPRGKLPSERGQAIILVVFAIIGLLGMAALAIDGGNAYVDQHRAQTAADAAALTGAITRIEGGDWRKAALESAAANGYDNNGTTNTVELNTPPVSGPYAGNSEYIQVIVTSHLRTFFGPVIGVREITTAAQAVSQSKPAVLGEMFEGYAIVSLAPQSECNKPKKRSFWIHGEATLSVEGGGIFVNSDNRECAFISYGSGSIRINDDSPFTIVGGASIQKPQLLTPFPPQVGAAPMAYPPAFQMPRVSCGSKVAEVDEENGIITAGNWDDNFPPEGVSQMEGGVYCIGGDVIVEDGQVLIGNGVTLVVEGNIKFSGNAEVHLTAKNGGQLAGLLIYVPLGNQSRLVLNGNGNSEYRGTILAPSADIRITGNESRYGFHSQIIGYRIEIDGIDNIILKYLDEQNYDAFKMPEVILSQ
ncbi:MAG: pilus assembly protein TadG-related protein [Chloroflexota bacterium]